jgi:membrane protein required for colicin V production
MNWFDLLLVLILAASVLTSFRKGLSREVIGLVSVILAIICGTWFYGTAGALVQPYVSSPGVAHLAGFFLVFLAVMLLGALVGFIVGKFLRVTGLSFFDHILGAAFGLVRGVLIAVALITGIMAFSPAGNPPAAVVHSRLAPYVVDGARFVSSIAPHELREGFGKTYAEVKSAWGKAVEQLPGADRLPRQEKGQHERKI